MQQKKKSVQYLIGKTLRKLFSNGFLIKFNEVIRLMSAKYIYTSGDNNPDSAKEIVPILFSLFNPKSVIDVGCGTGIFLKCFKDVGVKEIFGIDGKWVDKNLLFQNI